MFNITIPPLCDIKRTKWWNGDVEDAVRKKKERKRGGSKCRHHNQEMLLPEKLPKIPPYSSKVYITYSRPPRNAEVPMVVQSLYTVKSI